MKKLPSVDVIIDGAGGQENWNAFLKIITVGGSIVNYGATAGVSVSINLPAVFLKHVAIKGSTLGNSVEFKEMVEFVEKYKIKPIISRIVHGLDNFEEAFEDMRKGDQFGKLVIDVGSRNKL